MLSVKYSSGSAQGFFPSLCLPYFVVRHTPGFLKGLAGSPASRRLH